VERSRQKEISEILEVTGELKSFAQSRARVDAPLAGKLVELRVNVGDQVESGQVVAILESGELARLMAEYHHAQRKLDLLSSTQGDKKLVAQLGQENRSTVEEMQAALQSAHLQEEKALAQQKLRASRRARVEKLLAQGIASQQQAEQTRNLETEAELNYRAAVEKRKLSTRRYERELKLAESSARTNTAVRTTEAELALAREEVKHISELLVVLGKQLNDDSPRIALRALQGGVVKELKSVVGAQLDEGETVLELVRYGAVYPAAYIPESMLSKVEVGTSASLFLESREEPLRAEIQAFSPDLDRETRTLEARLQLHDNPPGLTQGLYLRAELEARARQAVVVPRSSITEYEGKQVVYVETGPNEFERRPVTVGILWRDSQEIIDGLKEGQRVAVGGVFLLKSLQMGTAEE
jgi:HlyD family secretion protein